MKLPRKSPLLRFLAQEKALEDFEAEDLSLIIAEARSSGLLGRLAHVAGLSSRTPPLASPFSSFHGALSAAATHAGGFARDVHREAGFLEKALSGLNGPVVLLKGASYVVFDLPPGKGRTFSDIDLLVDKSQLANAEAALMLGGWSTGKLSDYDQRYYREWSHEIPPMTHRQRGTTIDLHHSLVMPTCRIKVDSAKMVADAVPAGNGSFWWRLKDEDIVLHAACHLLVNSEFDRGLRDLWDIDLLYRHFCEADTNFPERLFERAKAIGLESVIARAMWVTRGIFNTPVPPRLLPKGIDVVTRLLSVSASTRHPDTRPRGQEFTDFILAYRELFLRLPARLLTVHLLHKAITPFNSSTSKAAV